MGSPAFSWIAEPLIVGVSFVVFAILDIVDRLLCVVFWALDSILDSETTPCYCKHRVRGAVPICNSAQNLLSNVCEKEDECGDSPLCNVDYACAERSSHSNGIEASPSKPKHNEYHPSGNAQCKSHVPTNEVECGDFPSFHAEYACGDCPSHAKRVRGIKDSSSQAKHSEGHPSHAYGTGQLNSFVTCSQECKSFVKLSHGDEGCPSDDNGQPSRAKQGSPSHANGVHGGRDGPSHSKHVHCSKDCLSHASYVHGNGDDPSHAKHAHGSEGRLPCAKDVNGCQDPFSHTHAHGSEGGSSLHPSNIKFLRPVLSRWSDCGCSICTSWQSDGMEHLYVHVEGKGHENVVFIHGFLSSSALWSERVIPHLPHESRTSHRLFAVDLLGFGKSPKPRSCLYTMADHIKKIEESVLHRYKIDSFHLVAHSMGCIVALALAAAYVDSIKTITLVAPPYFPAPANEAGASYVLRQLAPRRIWPPTAFGASVMSWYEHVGRGVCFLLCKQHFIWEWVLSILTLNRISRSDVCDFMQHTHHSAWHIFHNVICAEAHAMDGYLSILEKGSCKIHVIHGKDDSVVPAQCSYQLQKQIQKLELEVLDGVNHFTVIYGQEKSFALKLHKIWRNEILSAIRDRKR